MKRVGFLYEKACDLDLIRHAIRQAAKGKTQKHYIAKVLANEEAYAMRIKEMLETNTLRLSPNRQIVLFDHSCMKERVITVPKFFPDQVVHWVVALVLDPIFKKGMYRYNCGSIPRRGGLEAKKYVEKCLKDEKVRYVAKLDISKFFNSVKPCYLMEMFQEDKGQKDVESYRGNPRKRRRLLAYRILYITMVLELLSRRVRPLR